MQIKICKALSPLTSLLTFPLPTSSPFPRSLIATKLQTQMWQEGPTSSKAVTAHSSVGKCEGKVKTNSKVNERENPPKTVIGVQMKNTCGLMRAPCQEMQIRWWANNPRSSAGEKSGLLPQVPTWTILQPFSSRGEENAMTLGYC